MKNVWIDCDPGIDDSIMLKIAADHRDLFNIAGISAVAGNQSSDKVLANALSLSAFLGMEDVPVSRGAQRPLLKEAEDAGDVHGKNGLGDVEIPYTEKKETGISGVLAMRNAIMSLDDSEKMTLVTTGPMTDAALLLRTFPECIDKIEEIVLMGGSGIEGNVTPFAEYNVYADPEAAQIVYTSGLPIVMCGLDVTNQCRIYKDQIARMAASSDPVTNTYGRILTYYANCDFHLNMDYIQAHDTTTFLYLLHPELFSGRKVTIEVICDGEQTGRTVCSDGGNVLLIDTVDADKYNEIIMDCFEL